MGAWAPYAFDADHYAVAYIALRAVYVIVVIGLLVAMYRFLRR